jgi:hypothetical protein
MQLSTFSWLLVPATADVAEIDGKLAGYNDHVFRANC